MRRLSDGVWGLKIVWVIIPPQPTNSNNFSSSASTTSFFYGTIPFLYIFSLRGEGCNPMGFVGWILFQWLFHINQLLSHFFKGSLLIFLIKRKFYIFYKGWVVVRWDWKAENSSNNFFHQSTRFSIFFNGVITLFLTKIYMYLFRAGGLWFDGVWDLEIIRLFMSPQPTLSLMYSNGAVLFFWHEKKIYKEGSDTVGKLKIVWKTFFLLLKTAE